MSARLVDLEPRFIVTATEQRIGLSFKCPGCDDPGHRVAVNVDPPFDPGPTPGHAWKRTGEGFEDLTLTPSVLHWRIDEKGRMAECWHGFITNGVAAP